MLVPNYNDIGKRFKDLFDKNFPAGFVKIAANFPKLNDVSLNISGSQNIDSGKLVSTLDTKMNLKIANKDFLLIEKWTVSNEIQSILEVNVMDNLKSVIELNFDPNSGRKSMKFKNNYTSELVNLSGDVECRQIEPILTLSSMIKFIPSIPFYGGALISFDTYKQRFTKIGYGIQYNTDETCLSGSLTNHNDVIIQAVRKIAQSMEVAVEGGWRIDSKTPTVGVAVKHEIGDNNSVKAKIETNGNVSLSYTFLARDGVKLTFGAKLDSKNLNGGGHKLGLQIEL